MPDVRTLPAALACCWALFVGPAATAGADPKVTLVRTPNGGLQPQAVMDAHHTLHLIYFKGEPGAGDLIYVRQEPGQERFSAPLQVNSLPGSAVAIGTVRGGQMALGKGGRVHVAWNGSARAAEAKEARGTPMLYARLNDEGTAFEEQRSLNLATILLDGGGTVAADDSGNVDVAWHAQETGSTAAEEERQVWVAHSKDDGESFSSEIPAWTQPTGSCGCCSMRGLMDRDGSSYLLYRSARGGDRGIYLLSSARSRGPSYQGALVHSWEVTTCPMSTMALAEGPKDVVSAWETDGQIYFSRIRFGSTDFSALQSAPGPGRARKHPAVAVNEQGEMILGWTEGTGWQRGGGLAWQVFDENDKPSWEPGRLPGGIPVWGLPTVVATDAGFTILH